AGKHDSWSCNIVIPEPFRQQPAGSRRIKHRFNAWRRCWAHSAGARLMIRKLILPALAALLLAGCASYQYRGGSSGDYYYGQPGTEYRYYGYPYGYGGYGYGGYGYGAYGYGYPSYFSYRSYYGYPYGYGGYYRPPYKGPHHGHGHGNGQGGNHNGGNGPGPGQNPPPAGNDNHDRPTAPWRDLERLRERARTHDRVRPSSAEPSATPYRRVVPQRANPVRPAAQTSRSRAMEAGSI